ncbi:MAG: cadmium-translocating P-type ATPase [Lachnospiraceae bacterium]|nr:cadmium-translocating P-type ATPase [Lachnospiraceae bacterium]
MTKKLKKRLRNIILGAIIFLCALVIQHSASDINVNILLGIFLIAYFIIGFEVVKKAGKNIVNGRVMDENFLMMIATVGAFIVGDYAEAVAVMLFYQIGEWFQSYAVNKSRKSISDLMDIRPDYANVLRDGKETQVDPDEVQIGEIIVVKAGEKIPLDGIVIKGNTTVDTMALTGESVPRDLIEGEEVISGCINLTGMIEVRVTKEFGQSTVARILDLVENAGSKKAEAENFISKFAKYYTPTIVVLALLLAFLPPILIDGDYFKWIYRALSFLVISCPCALVISIPLSFFGGIGGASREGILVKGSNYLELLSKAGIVVMDKTGTLTKGSFQVKEIHPAKEASVSEEKLLELAAYSESFSNHPISKSLKEAYFHGKETAFEFDKKRIGETKEIPGYGIEAHIDGNVIYVGNSKLMERQKVSYEQIEANGTVIYVAEGKQYLGYLVIGDEIKADSRQAVEKLYKAGIREIVMLTGDRQAAAQSVAKELGIKKVFSELLPGDKVEKVEGLLKEKSEKEALVFVGDGINDAPVLARADVGIAMGGLGQDAAIEAADIVIMTDEPSKIARAMEISRKTLTIVKENIVFAIGIKVIVLILAAVGIASMWLAIFADVGVAFMAILNAMRTLRAKSVKSA